MPLQEWLAERPNVPDSVARFIVQNTVDTWLDYGTAGGYYECPAANACSLDTAYEDCECSTLLDVDTIAEDRSALDGYLNATLHEWHKHAYEGTRYLETVSGADGPYRWVNGESGERIQDDLQARVVSCRAVVCSVRFVQCHRRRCFSFVHSAAACSFHTPVHDVAPRPREREVERERERSIAGGRCESELCLPLRSFDPSLRRFAQAEISVLALKILSKPGRAGAMSTGSAITDPLFWVIHPLFEKGWHVLRLAPRYAHYDMGWTNGTCHGSRLHDDQAFANVFDERGHYYTNAELIELLDPRKVRKVVRLRAHLRFTTVER